MSDLQEEFRTRVMISLSQGTVDAWRATAKTLGYTTTHGKMAHKGNISGLMTAIANGEVSTRKLAQVFRAVRESIEMDFGDSSTLAQAYRVMRETIETDPDGAVKFSQVFRAMLKNKGLISNDD